MNLFNKYQGTRVGKFLNQYAKPHIFQIVLVFLLASLIGLVGAAPAKVIKYVTDKVLVDKDMATLRLICISMVILIFLKGVAIYFNNYISAKISGKIGMSIREDLYKQIHNLSFDFFSESKSGDLMSRFTIDTDRALTIIMSSFKAFADIIQVTLSLILLFYTDFKLALICLLVLPMVMNVIKKYSKRLRSTGRDIQDSFGKLNTILQEGIGGIRVVKAFAAEEYEIEKYHNENLENFRHTIKNRRLDARVKPLVEFINSLAVISILFYGGFIVVRGGMTSGDLMQFLLALGLTAEPIKRIADYVNNLNTAIPAVDRLYEILEMESTITSKETALIPNEIKGTVTLENVSFSYNEERDVLNNVSLLANVGEMVALVGQSGSGKSTLVNLLPRFYDVSKGSIKIDEFDIRDIDLHTLRKNIGIVPQETFLFSGSVRDNIIYGKRDASDEEVINALKMANAYNFVMDLPEGLNTEVGERGVLLSGGQKQRLSIARAILENPPIMILDEATSALDTESERLVQDALDKLMTNRTTFVIAHRLSTILHADKIVVMENGEIKEIGTHQELLNRKGIYTKLYETQFGKLEEEINA